jgi:signal transduction histidine kinase
MSALPAVPPRFVPAGWVARLPAFPIDLLITAIAEASILWGLAQSRQADVAQGLAAWPWWLYPLVAALPLPLLWRRRAPFAVMLLCGLGTVGLGIPYYLAVTWNHSSEFMLLVAMATVAYYRTGWKFWLCALTSVGFNFVVVPQSFGKNAIGALVMVIAFVAGRLGAQQRDLARMMAGRAQEAESAAEARAAQAAAEERTRIARDMHDILAHAVSLMIVQAEAGAAVLHQDPDKAERAFDAIADGGRDALTQLRRLLGVLRDGDALALSPQPTLAGLAGLVETVRAARVDVRMVVEGQPYDLPKDTEVALYRTAQEALTNTVKHAHAERAEVRLDWTAQALSLRVTDDGVGPRPGQPGRGLIGIRERISACGGTVQSGPGPQGRGFQLQVTIPAPRDGHVHTA